MQRPSEEIEGYRQSHERLAISLTTARIHPATRPSLLPGWTLGHVIGHLARNAEAMVHRIDAATRGEVIDQYEGGPVGRAAAIEASADQTTDVIVSDALHWCDRLDSLFASLSDDVWAMPVRTVVGGEHPIGLLPFRRWREVEVHHADLDVGFTPSDWSPGLVERALPRLMTGLADRADPAALVAWMLGRGPSPDLDPWV